MVISHAAGMELKMKISTKGRYGLRAMVDLAINSREGCVTLVSIAERQNVSVKYLEQVFSILKKGGLVQSVKGAQGGYVMSDNTENITVGDILRTLEGDLSIVPEQDNYCGVSGMHNKQDNQGKMDRYLNKNLWRKINEEINHIVNSTTLKQLVDEYDYMVSNN